VCSDHVGAAMGRGGVRSEPPLMSKLQRAFLEDPVPTPQPPPTPSVLQKIFAFDEGMCTGKSPSTSEGPWISAAGLGSRSSPGVLSWLNARSTAADGKWDA